MTFCIHSAARRLRADESGQALAEFALVMPLLFLLIAGILGFGRVWNIQQVVTDAAREGARMTVVQDENIEEMDVRLHIQQRLHNVALDTTDATITIEPIADWRVVGKPMTVTVEIPYQFPLLSVLMDWATGSPNFNLSSTTTMRNE